MWHWDIYALMGVFYWIPNRTGTNKTQTYSDCSISFTLAWFAKYTVKLCQVGWLAGSYVCGDWFCLINLPYLSNYSSVCSTIFVLKWQWQTDYTVHKLWPSQPDILTVCCLQVVVEVVSCKLSMHAQNKQEAKYNRGCLSWSLKLVMADSFSDAMFVFGGVFHDFYIK